MGWSYLFLAGLLEISWAVGLKYTHGMTRLWPSIWTVAGMIASFWFLAIAVRTLPLGTAYAVWTGIGVVGTTILGMVLLDEPKTWLRFVCVAMILAGIVGLKLQTPAPSSGPQAAVKSRGKAIPLSTS